MSGLGSVTVHHCPVGCAGRDNSELCEACGGRFWPLLGVARTVGALWAGREWNRQPGGPWRGNQKQAAVLMRLTGHGRPAAVRDWLARTCEMEARALWEQFAMASTKA